MWKQERKRERVKERQRARERDEGYRREMARKGHPCLAPPRKS